ncbi:MAG: hypothetical protein ACYC3I_21065 [Gemmataceae bacterium]
MNDSMDLQNLLAASERTSSQSKALFALLNLGIVESLANGLISAADAPRVLYNADNCLFVRKQLRDKTADEIMSRGVQLPDIFEALPADEAQREFQHELATLRGLCLKLLENKPLVA